jgi:hypothetical protein
VIFFSSFRKRQEYCIKICHNHFHMCFQNSSRPYYKSKLYNIWNMSTSTSWPYQTPTNRERGATTCSVHHALYMNNPTKQHNLHFYLT